MRNSIAPHVAMVMVLGFSAAGPKLEAAEEQMLHDHHVDRMPVPEQGPPSQGGIPPMLRDPRAFSDGYDLGPIPRPRMADEHSFAALLVDRLEWVHASDNESTIYDLQAWYGRDYDRVVFKAEGEVDNGEINEGRAEALWGHAISPFWDAHLGLRFDHGVGPERSWLALGVQGLAPYWLEISATAYVGEENRTALRVDGELDLWLTQRLILQPRLEMNVYGKSDAARALGSGLSDLAAGLRLRYEIRRELAPYAGIEWTGKYGGTADYARPTRDSIKETRWIAGVRFWF